jgi:hypothetical protein
MTALLLALSLLSPDASAGTCGLQDGTCADIQAVVQARPTAKVKAAAKVSDPLKVSRGQVTFDSEGNDNSKSIYFSRKLHWPGGASGVTIGRGYDMKYRTEKEIKADLIAAGVPEATAAKLAKGAKLTGAKAKKFTRDNKALQITAEQQKALFDTVYAEYDKMTKGLVCGWAGKSGAACDTFWSGLDDNIRQMLVDLRYRGDLTKSRYKLWLSKSVAANDLKSFAKVMTDRVKWARVPKDRFERRKAFIEKAAAGATTTAVPIPRRNPFRQNDQGDRFPSRR